jgi:DNA-binding transcriptional LysR family regulator
MEPMIEHRFRQLGIDRATAIGTQSIVIQPLVLAGTRMMALVPERFGRYFAGQAGIRMLDPPYSLDPPHLAMFWAPRADHDPAHRWLRERVLRAAAALDGRAEWIPVILLSVTVATCTDTFRWSARSRWPCSPGSRS